MKRQRTNIPPSLLLGAAVLLAGVPLKSEAAPAAKPAAKPRPAAAARPASPARTADPLAVRGVANLLPGLRHLPGDPMLVAAVQVNAVDNFLRMMTGGATRDASGTDLMVGALKLLKDQINGPLSVGVYPDATGKTYSLLMAAHLKESTFTRELLGGFVTLGGDEKNPPRQEKYKGQNLVSLNLPKSPAGSLPLLLQPTFSVTTTDFLLIGTSLPVVKQSIDAGATPTGVLGARADLAAMLREIPLGTATDVWVFVPEPTRNLKGKPTPFPIPVAGLPLGPTVVSLRFTPTGVRFEGLASVDRSKAKAAQTPRTP